MTPQEHKMMMLMFARMYQHYGILMDVLKSRELLTGDDAQAFSHAAHFDDQKTMQFVLRAWRDYQAAAIQSDVVTGLESGPPPEPK